MSLHAKILLRHGDLRLDLELAVGDGTTLALVGPNGAGKSSLLHCLAGLNPIDQGRVELGDRVLDAGPDGPVLEPRERQVGLLFQDLRLFPHLSALDNVAYGSRHRRPQDRRADAAAWLARVGLPASLHGQRPASLSGGQQQRAALARALCSEPRLLLLDEPLAAVDAPSRPSLRRDLRSHLSTFAGPRILVTHDLTDALALADSIAVLEQGRIVQQGRLEELVARPRSQHIADLVGVNCFVGVATDGLVQLVGGGVLQTASRLQGEVLVIVHPRAVSLFRTRPDGSPRNVLLAPVVGIEPSLDRVRIRLGGEIPMIAEVTPSAVAALGLSVGASVFASLKATELMVQPR